MFVPESVEEIANLGRKNSRIVIAECGNENHEVQFKLFRQNRQWKFIQIIIACFGKNEYNFELILLNSAIFIRISS